MIRIRSMNAKCLLILIYVRQYTRLQASQSDKDSEMETLRSTQQELDSLQAKVRRKTYFGN